MDKKYKLSKNEVEILTNIKKNNPMYKDIHQILNICANNLSVKLSNRICNSEIKVLLYNHDNLIISSKIEDDIDYFYHFIFDILPKNGYKLSHED